MIPPGSSDLARDATPEDARPTRASKVFYMGSILLGVQAIPLAGMAGIGYGMPISGHLRWLTSAVLLASFAGVLYAGVVALVLLHRMWSVIRGESARTTPLRAVVFLLIPVYNLLWLFQAFWGWTVDYNRFVAERGLDVRRMPEELARTACILTVVAAFLAVVPVPGIPLPLTPLLFFAFPLAIAAGVILLIVLWYACDGVNALADVPGAAPAGRALSEGGNSGLAAASFILGLTGLATWGVGSLVGLGLGMGALREIRKSEGRIGGRDLAKLGVVLSLGGLSFGLLPMLFAVLIQFSSIG